ncbi:hypothetical protein D3C73_970880 [compost metagenome]
MQCLALSDYLLRQAVDLDAGDDPPLEQASCVCQRALAGCQSPPGAEHRAARTGHLRPGLPTLQQAHACPRLEPLGLSLAYLYIQLCGIEPEQWLAWSHPLPWLHLHFGDHPVEWRSLDLLVDRLHSADQAHPAFQPLRLNPQPARLYNLPLATRPGLPQEQHCRPRQQPQQQPPPNH